VAGAISPLTEAAFIPVVAAAGEFPSGCGQPLNSSPSSARAAHGNVPERTTFRIGMDAVPRKSVFSKTCLIATSSKYKTRPLGGKSQGAGFKYAERKNKNCGEKTRRKAYLTVSLKREREREQEPCQVLWFQRFLSKSRYFFPPAS
jgi:hypothetical protein